VHTGPAARLAPLGPPDSSARHTAFVYFPDAGTASTGLVAQTIDHRQDGPHAPRTLQPVAGETRAAVHLASALYKKWCARLPDAMARSSLSWRGKPLWMWWTGGKDSAWALSELKEAPEWNVRGLLGLVNERNGRAMLHGVTHHLLERQAAAVGLPLRLVALNWTTSSSERSASIRSCLDELRSDGAQAIAFSDLYSQMRFDRRLQLMNGTGMEAVLPLWKRETKAHCARLLESGLSAWVCSVDTTVLSIDYSGRRFGPEFLGALPPGVDPCGENDEYHTFVEWAPGWDFRVSARPTRSIEVYDFGFTELEPTTAHAGATARAPNDSWETAPSPAGSREPCDAFSYSERLDRVRRYVDQHLADNLTGAEIAKVAAMAPTAFARYFRQHTRTTFSAWLLVHRVRHAKELLRTSDSSVARVGDIVGFRSDRTFRRAFQKVVGCSPSQFRRRWFHAPREDEGG